MFKNGIDPVWVVALGILLTIEQGIGQGSVSLTNVVPPTWAPYVQGWCSLLAFIGTAIMTGMSAYSSNKSGPLVGAPVVVPPAAKATLAFIAVLLASFLMTVPASAQLKITPRARPPAPVATSAPRPSAATATAPSGKITVTQAQQNPLLVIQQFTATDLQNALNDANAQTPPDTVAAACYTALLVVVGNPINNPLPNAPGAFLLFQKARDLQSLLSNLQSPTGPLQPINTACAPLILSAENTLIQLGIIGGGVTAVASTGGLALPAMPLLGNLLAILPK